jgi:hypothetical protein
MLPSEQPHGMTLDDNRSVVPPNHRAYQHPASVALDADSGLGHPPAANTKSAPSGLNLRGTCILSPYPILVIFHVLDVRSPCPLDLLGSSPAK